MVFPLLVVVALVGAALPPPFYFHSETRFDPTTNASDTLIIPHEENFYSLFNGNFMLTVGVTPLPSSNSITISNINVLPLFINTNVESATSFGLTIGGNGPGRNSTSIRLGTGQAFAGLRFNHPFITDGILTTHILTVQQTREGRKVAYSLNGQPLGEETASGLFGPFYAGQGIVFGALLGWEFSGLFHYLRVEALGPCYNNPCGMNANCIDLLDGSYSCQCKSGFARVFDSISASCEAVEPSCSTCGVLGWSSPNNNQEFCSSGSSAPCSGLVSFADAQQFCSSLGARICTMAELVSAQDREKCNEALRVWSLDSCANGTRITTAALPQHTGRNPVRCTDPSEKFPVKCCADRKPAFRSVSSCSDLNWPLLETNADVSHVCSSDHLRLIPDNNKLLFDEAGQSTSCFDEVSFFRAESLCLKSGARLCTSSELTKAIQQHPNQCNFTLARVWAEADCLGDETKAWVVNSATGEATCMNKVADSAVRCCADVVALTPAEYSAYTCSQLGWRTQTSVHPSSDEVCGHSLEDCSATAQESEKRTFAQAQNYCLAKGARLCSYPELVQEESAGTGCLYDQEIVWSSTPCRKCDMNGHITARGRPVNVFFNRPNCTHDEGLAFVRCCADTLAPCSKAGTGNNDCDSIHRQPCSTHPNLCGGCLPGFAGTKGPSNQPDCKDISPPQLSSCPSNITLPANSTGVASVVFRLPKATDNDVLKSLTADPPSGTAFAVGKTTVLVVAEDRSGLTSTCSFVVTVTGSVGFSQSYNQTLNRQNIILPSLPFFVNLLNADFSLILSTIPSELGPGFSPAPFYAQQNPVSDRDLGFSIGGTAALSELEVRLGNATATASLKFGHPAVRINATARWQVTVQLRVTPPGRIVRFFLDDELMGEQVVDISGDIITQGPFVIGQVAGQRFTGVVNHVSLTVIDACDAQPCVDHSICVVDPNNANKYQCVCEEGFYGEPSLTGQNCTALPISCQTCSELLWPQLGNVNQEDGCVGNTENTCASNATFAEAVGFCTAFGARLCTPAEIALSSSQDIDGKCPPQRTWTVHECDGGAISQDPTLQQASTSSICSPVTERLAVRCCADPAPSSTSHNSCESLGWDFISPTSTVCTQEQTRSFANLQPSRNPICQTSVSHTTATAMCLNMGARLCTTHELSMVSNLGETCQYFNGQVWASQSCTPNGHAAWMMTNNGLVCANKSTTENVGAFCCADDVTVPFELSPKSCKDLGWNVKFWPASSDQICAHSFVNCSGAWTGPEKEKEKMTFQQAQDYCYGVGGRLCTAAEVVLRETTGSGCQYDKERVWTSTQCNKCQAGSFTLAGDVALLDDVPLVCSPVTERHYVRCCADVPVRCDQAGRGDGNCAALLRDPCSNTINTCGDCLMGLSGTPGPSNEDNCRDVMPPIITGCPVSQVLRLSNPSLTHVATWDAPTATDNFDLQSLTSSHSSGSSFPVGTTMVTYTAVDAFGLTATCSFNITVVAGSPVFSIPGQVKLNDQTATFTSDLFPLLASQSFILTTAVTPSLLTGQYRALSMYVLQEVLSASDIGFMFYNPTPDNNSTRFSIANGKQIVTRTMTHSPLQPDTTTVFRFELSQTKAFSTVRLYLNGRFIKQEVFNLVLPTITSNVISFGSVLGLKFSGTLRKLQLEVLDDCSRNNYKLCGTSASCTLLQGGGHKCTCLPGYIGEADSKGKGCEVPPRSCKTCAALAYTTISESFPSQAETCVERQQQGVCEIPMSYLDARDRCSSRGARLCTVSELDLVLPRNLPCSNADVVWVWTKHFCPGGRLTYHMTSGGNANATRCTPTSKENRHHSVCCGDGMSTWQSSRNCASLGWATPGTTCGASLLTRNETGGFVSPQCLLDKTHEQAEVICALVGGRLCRAHETAADLTGCSSFAATRAQWTAEECANPDFAYARNTSGLYCLPKATTTGTIVRCCADANVGLILAKLSASSCQSLGWPLQHEAQPLSTHVCGSPECALNTPDSSSLLPVSHAEAESMCQGQGARLCTMPELLGQEAAITGCPYNKRQVWSSTPCTTCNMDGYFTHAASLEHRQVFPKACTSSKNGTAYVTCCADDAAPCENAGNGDGNCTVLNRSPCSTIRHTCGRCLPGTVSGTMFGNTLCKDITPPALSCPSNMTVTLSSRNISSVSVEWQEPRVSDNIALVNVSVTPPSGSLFSINEGDEPTAVKVIAEDSSGLVSQCTFFVHVTRPDLECSAGEQYRGEVCLPCLAGSADEDKDPSTPCSPCIAGTHQSLSGQTVCISNSVCKIGFGEIRAPTASTDRACRACQVDVTFNDRRNASAPNMCHPVQHCSPGSFVVADPTTTSDRNCSQCVLGATFQTETNQPACTPVQQECTAGEYEELSPSLTSDRACASCPATTFKTSSGVGPCQPCRRQCPAGFFLKTPCDSSEPGRTFDAMCEPCPGGTFSASLNNDTACTPLRDSCSPGFFLSQLGSATQDIVCTRCTPCPANALQSGGCLRAENQDTLCQTCITSCPTGEALIGECTQDQFPGPSCRACDPTCATCNGVTDRNCTSCGADRVLTHLSSTTSTCVSGCGLGQFFDNTTTRTCRPCHSSCGSRCNGPLASNCLACEPNRGLFLLNGECVADCGAGFFRHATTQRCWQCSSSCPAGHFLAKPCSRDADSQCQPWTKCVDGREYVLVPGSSTADTQCATCLQCQPGSRRTLMCEGDATHDTQCEPCVLGSSFQDLGNQTVCKPVSQCAVIGVEYEVRAPTLTSDRVCGSVQSCDFSTQYESTPPTRSNNRVCLATSTCQPGVNYESKAPTLSTDRQCVPVQQCSPGKTFEVTAPTSSTDRHCGQVSECNFEQQYMAVDATPTSDRQCALLTLCFIGSESVSATPTSDRVCTAAVEVLFDLDYESVASPVLLAEFQVSVLTGLARIGVNVSTVALTILPGSVLVVISTTNQASVSLITVAISSEAFFINFGGAQYTAVSVASTTTLAPAQSGSDSSDTNGQYIVFGLVGVTVLIIVGVATFICIMRKRLRSFDWKTSPQDQFAVAPWEPPPTALPSDYVAVHETRFPPNFEVNDKDLLGTNEKYYDSTTDGETLEPDIMTSVQQEDRSLSSQSDMENTYGRSRRTSRLSLMEIRRARSESASKEDSSSEDENSQHANAPSNNISHHQEKNNATSSGSPNLTSSGMPRRSHQQGRKPPAKRRSRSKLQIMQSSPTQSQPTPVQKPAAEGQQEAVVEHQHQDHDQKDKPRPHSFTLVYQQLEKEREAALTHPPTEGGSETDDTHPSNYYSDASGEDSIVLGEQQAGMSKAGVRHLDLPGADQDMEQNYSDVDL
eukprot:m.183153 g.183153  ORF g.183153 m.183153 type:complete len:3304 (+) comp25500_c0_seq1:45-9956(+)